MNWYAVGVAAAAGALAAGIAMLVVPKRTERRIAYVAVFVFVFSVLNALAKEFVLPALTFPSQMAEAEQAFLEMPVFRAIKQHDRATYDGFMTDLKEGLKSGKKEAELIGQMKPRIEQLIQRRIPIASDQAVVTYISVMTREMRELNRQDPALCYKFLFPQQYGAINIATFLPKELMDADLAALTEVIRTSAENPQPSPKQEEVSADLNSAVAELNKKHKDSAAVLQNLQASSVDKAHGCEVTADLYDIMIALPPERGGKLLKYMLSQG